MGLRALGGITLFSATVPEQQIAADSSFGLGVAIPSELRPAAHIVPIPPLTLENGLYLQNNDKTSTQVVPRLYNHTGSPVTHTAKTWWFAAFHHDSMVYGAG